MDAESPRIGRILVWLYRHLASKRNYYMGLAGTYLLARVLEIPNTYPDVNSILAAELSIQSRPTNLITWIALLALVLLPVATFFLKRWYKSRHYEKLFIEMMKWRKDPQNTKYNAFSIGAGLTLQSCPDLARGWLASTIELRHSTDKFSIPGDLQSNLKTYVDENWDKERFSDDRTKIMLKRNPRAFSDSPTLVLQTQETKYSHVQFYRHEIAPVSVEREALTRRVFEDGEFFFPQAFCLQLIVVTADNQVLLTQRSPKVDYFPKTWSCSISEQMAIVDIPNGRSDSFVTEWIKRALWEELGLSRDSTNYDDDNMRVFSVFLESDILNTSLCARVKVNFTAGELRSIVSVKRREDYELTECNFVTPRELLDEFFYPTRSYHPVALYTMFFALLTEYNEEEMARILAQHPRAG